MQQALHSITFPHNKPLTRLDAKQFMDWVVTDVKKEGQCELDASGLKWDDVTPQLKKYSSMWFKSYIEGQSPNASSSSSSTQSDP
jgi:hypothetical protein